jgi:hypothetical protein
MKSITRTLLAGLVVGLLMALPQNALAQRDAGAKARGDYSGTFWSSKSAGRSVGHAQDYSRGVQEYVRSAPKPSPQYLQSEAGQIAQNLKAAKAEITYLKKQLADDKEMAVSVASIEKHLDAAEAQHDKFHAECAKASIDADATMDCCSALTDHLTKAHDELEDLQKKLAPKTPTSVKK